MRYQFVGKLSVLIVITVTVFFIQKILKLLNLFQLSEMTADLGEEHSIATTVANERLEVEQSEKMKIEKDRGELQVKATRFSKLDSHVFSCKNSLKNMAIFFLV